MYRSMYVLLGQQNIRRDNMQYVCVAFVGKSRTSCVWGRLGATRHRRASAVSFLSRVFVGTMYSVTLLFWWHPSLFFSTMS